MKPVDLEAQVSSFLAAELSISPDRIRADSRIAEDFGVDGDDAVELFREFGKRFDVDLTEVFEHWDEHFGGEGSGFGFGCLVVIGAAVLGAEVLQEATRAGPRWTWAIILLGLFGWIYHRTKANGRVRLPVVVVDLIEAARAGEWVKEYD